MMFFSSRRAVGIDLGDSSVKVIEAERDGKTIRVHKAVVRSLPPGLTTSDPEGLGRFLRELFDDNGLRATSAWLGVPRHQAVLRTIKVPPGNETQTQQMIRIQARKTMPMSAEGLSIGYILKETEGERSAVLVGAKQDVIAGLKKTCSVAGLKVAGITLSSFGTANAYLNAYPDGAPGIVVDIGGSMTEITLSCWGRFGASRQASIGSESLIHRLGEEAGISRSASSQAVRGAKLGPQAAPGVTAWAKELSTEVDRTIRGFAAEGLPAPERLLVTGGGAQVGGLAQFLSGELGMQVEPFAPNAGIPSWPQGSVSEPGALMLPALGYLLGGLSGMGTKFDFCRDFFARADARPPRSKKVIAAVAGLVFLAAAWLVPDWYLDQLEDKAARREASLSEDEKKHKGLIDELESKRRDLRGWVGRRERWIDVLREITLSVPEDKEVFLTNTHFKEGLESLKILGQAVSEESVNDFVKSLSKSQRFKRVERRMIIQHDERRERHKMDFELNVVLAPQNPEVAK